MQLIYNKKVTCTPDLSVPLTEPSYGTVLELINAAALKFPENIAISDLYHEITYSNLISKLEFIAHILLQQGIKKNEIVAIHGKKSISLFITLIAALKMGAVIMPINDELPSLRKKAMIEKVNVKWALHIGSNYDIAFNACQNIDVEKFLNSNDIYIEKKTDKIKSIFPKIDGNAPAYIFFTSGTTSEPQPILGVHKAITHFIEWEREEFNLDHFVKISQLTSISFDAILRDLFLPLTTGGELCIPGKEELDDPYKLISWLHNKKITLIHTIPSILASWFKLKIPSKLTLKNLQFLCLSGEPLLDSLVSKWRECFPTCPAKLINFYGPSETTMIKAFHYIPNELLSGVQPCGKPISNTEILIFNEKNEIICSDEVGEVIIRTPFRTLGYFNNRKIENNNRFFVNPFRQDKDDILYRTGDLGYYTKENFIVINGRKDDEIKINGVRVNPLEVTSVLSLHPMISHCAVLPLKKENNNILIVFIVTNNNTEVEIEHLRKYLNERLPLAMVPSLYMLIDKMPLLSNGKINKQELLNKITLKKSPIVAEELDVIETSILNIWQETLNNNRIKTRDNFFEIGGNSIMAMLLITKLRHTFSMEISLKDLLENPTVKKISEIIKRDSYNEKKEISIPHLVNFQPGNIKNPVVMIHPVSGSIFCYHKLAHHLKDNYACYGIQADLNRKKQQLDTIENMATVYLQEIDKIDNNNQLILAGWSLGGLLAYEMAIQLQKEGKRPKSLFLFDSYAPQSIAYKGVNYEVEFNNYFAYDYISTRQENLDEYKSIFSKLNSHEQHQYLCLLLNKIDGISSEEAEFILNARITAFKTNMIAAAKYKPRQKLHAEINLFVSNELVFPFSSSSKKGWEIFTSVPLNITYLPGNHYSIFSDENIKRIANLMKG